MKETLVILDPGHGGMHNGQYVTAPSKMYDHGDFIFYEGVFNRQIADKLTTELDRHGIEWAYTTVGWPDMGLSERVKRANSTKALHDDKNVLYVSIHGNAAGTESAHGIEVFTYYGDSEADVLAEYVYESLSEMGWNMRKDLTDGDSDKEANYYVLRETDMPSILLELGFFTNRKEAQRMMRQDVQNDLARLVAEGINNYIQ